jgi:hypothetical protein
MWVLLILGAVMQLVAGIVALLINYELVWTPLESFAIIVGILGVGVVSYWRRLHYQEMVVKTLIYDFNAYLLSQADS